MIKDMSTTLEMPAPIERGLAASQRIRVVLALGTVLVFYSNIAVFARVHGLSPIPPAAFLIVIGVVALPTMALVGNTWQVLWSPVSGWLAAYFALTAIAFAATAPAPGVIDILGVVLQGVAYLGLALFLFADPAALKAARTGVTWCVIAGVFLNIVDFTHPLLFSPLVGRASGLYLNPNISALALVLGLIATIDSVSRKYRTIYVLLVCLGVLLTLSRGGLAGLSVALLGLIWTRRLVWSRVTIAAALLMVFVWVGILLAGAQDTVAVGAQQLGEQQLGRLMSQSTDFSTRVRIEVAKAGWFEFLGSPLIGAGIGRTFLWSFPSSTHNMYLRGLAEMGILGGLAFPAVALCATLGLPADRKAVGRVFLAAWLVIGLASHNMLEERPELTVLAMFAAEAIVARAPRTD